MANASFNSGFYNPSTNQTTFYIYWTGITASQLTQFTNADLTVVNAMGSPITGASAEVGPGDGNTFPITVSGLPSNSSGQLQVKVRANAIGTSLAVASPLINWSTRSAATFTIAGSDNTEIYTTPTGNTKVTSPFDVNTVYVNITSDVSVSDFTVSDIIVSGGCVGTLSSGTTSWRLAIGLTDNTAGLVTINIRENSISIGNNAKVFSFNYDRTTPSETGTPSTVTFGSTGYQTSTGAAVSRTRNGAITDGTFWVPINFNPSVRGFSAQDIFVTGACKGSLYPASTTGTTWRMEIQNQSNFKGVVTVGVFSDATSQSGGNHANSTQFSVDTTGGSTTTADPVVFEIGSIYDSDGNIVNPPLEDGPPTEYKIDIQATNKTANDFDLANIVVSGACVTRTALLGGDTQITAGRRWRLPIQLPDEEAGTVTIYIPANIVADGNAPKHLSFSYSTKEAESPSARPTVGLAYSAATGGNRLNELDITANSFYVDISFDSEVTGFTVSDIVVTNACKVSLTPALSTGRQWRLQIDNDDAFDGRVTIMIPSDVTTQSGGNIAASNSYVVNTTQATTSGNPTVFRILNAYDASTAGRNLTPRTDTILTASTVYVEITSSRPVSDFEASDINVSNGCIGARTTITAGSTWRIEVGLEADTAGTMYVIIPPNVVSVGNVNVRKGFKYDRSVVEPPAVGVTIGTPRSASTGGTVLTEPLSRESFYVPITFDSVISGFTKSDVVVNNACKGELTEIIENQSWRIHIDPEDNFKGIVTVSIPSDVTSQEGGNLAATRNFTVDQTPIIGTWRYAYFCPSDQKVHAAIRFTKAITGLSTNTSSTSNGDILVKSANRIDSLMGWTYAFSGNSGTTLSASTDLSLVITPPANTDTTIYLEFVVNTISYNGGQSLGPPETISSDAIIVNNEAQTAVTPATPTLGNPVAQSDGTGTVTMVNGKITDSSFFIQINFGKAITNFNIHDVIVTNACKGTDLVPANTHNGQIWYLSIDNHDDFDGTVTVAIAANVISSEGGNLPVNRNYEVNTTPSAITPTTITLHTPRTDISGTTAITGNISAGLFYVPITFSGTAVIDGFTIEDIIVTNGGRTNLQPKGSMVLTGSTFELGRSFMLTIATISGDDVPISITIPENVIRNPGGNTRVSRTYNIDTRTAATDAVSVTLHTPRTSIQGTTAITGNISAGSFYVPITFGGTANITGFDESDITVVNAGRGNLNAKTSGNSSMVLPGSEFPIGRSFVLKVDTVSGDESVVTVSVPFNATSQAGGNLAASRNYNVNTRGTVVDSAAVTIHTPRSNRSGTSVITGDINADVFYVPITFGGNQAITGFTDSDILVINACNAGITPKGSGVLTGDEFPSGRSFLLQIDTLSNEEAVVTVRVDENVTTQSGGNLSAFRNFDVDTTQTPVSVTIGTPRSNSNGTSPINGNITVGTFYVPIIFGGTTSVSGFSETSITVTNGGRGTLAEITGSGFPSGRSFLLPVNTISGEELTVTVSVPSNASNLSSGSLAASRNFNADTTVIPESPATITLERPYTHSTGGTEITSTVTQNDFYVPITFSKTVSGFNKNDIAVSGGCKGELYPTSRTSGTNWRLHIDNEEQFKGTVTVTIPSNIVSGAGNIAATRQYAVNTRRQINPATFVVQSPRASADASQGASEPIRTATWYAYITSNKTVSNLIAADILVTSATKARTVTTVEQGKKWTIQITNPTNFNGIVSVGVLGNVVSSSGGNFGTSRNFNVNTTTRATRTTPANFTIGPVYDASTGGSLVDTDVAIERASIYVQIDSGGIAVTDFDENDIFVSNGCRGTLTKQTGAMIADNTQWRLYIDLEEDTAGYVTIAIPPNVVSVGNNSISRSYQYNRLSAATVRVPPGAIFNVPVTLQTGMTSDIRVNFGERVMGLTSNDFQITGFTPAPSGDRVKLLAQDFEIQLSTATSTTPSITTTGTGIPSVSTVVRSPNAPSSGATRLWMITLSSASEQLTTSNIVGSTLSRAPSFIDDNYILRITNPSNSEGTLNAILQNDSVRSIDDNTLGPTFQQSSGSYGFDTIMKPEFSIDNIYETNTGTEVISLTAPITKAVVWIEISSNVIATGLEDTDIIVTGACAGTLHTVTDDRKWRIQVNIPEDIAGELTVAIPTDVVNEGNDPISRTFSFDRSGVPYIEITGWYDNETSMWRDEFPPTELMGTNVLLRIESKVDGQPIDISGLEPKDFEITSTDGSIIPSLLEYDPNP